MRRYVYQFILLTVLCCMPALSSAQQTKVVIRGVVTAAIDKLPLPGANVLLVNKDGRVVGNAVTDMDGNFTLDGVKNGDVIQISFIGYSTMELSLIHI